VQLGLSDKWDPRSLPPVTDPSPAVSFRKTVCEMAFAILGLVWLLLIPHHPFAILGPASAFLKLTSAWAPFYFPLVVLSALNVARLWIGLLRPQWKWFLPTTRLLNTGLFLLLLYFGLNTALRLPFNAESPFVALSNPAAASSQLGRVAAVVNVSALLALLATWLGLAIATPIELWQWMRNLRKGSFPSSRPFSSSQKALL
jgi:hypothetical protein